MIEAFICDAIRTPTGRYGGSLSAVRTDDLGVVPFKALMTRNPQVGWPAIGDVIFGRANQAGEDNHNVARMSSLLADLPDGVPGSTINRLCNSGADTAGTAARIIHSGEAALMIVGGVENMNRAPLVMGKAVSTFSRDATICDITIGWRFINPLIKAQYSVNSVPETAENVATDYKVNREDQDRFALRNQASAARAQEDGMLAQEITPVTIPQRKGDAAVVDRDEHPRAISMEVLAELKSVVHPDGTVTAGSASGMNDSAYTLPLANGTSAKRFGLTSHARIIGMATADVPSHVMGISPAPASQKLLKQLGLSIDQIDTIELNKAFAVRGPAMTRQLGLRNGGPRVNPNGGTITLGHPLGISGARLVTAAIYQLQRTGGRYALCTMYIGVGQGIVLMIERV